MAKNVVIFYILTLQNPLMNHVNSIDQLFLNKVHEAIENNLANENFGVDELAQIIGMSRSQLYRRLNTIGGQSTSHLIKEFRLKKAMEMLQQNMGTASEISYQVGFKNPSHFNTSFNKYFGYPPGKVKHIESLKIEDKPVPSTKWKISSHRSLILIISLLLIAVCILLYPKIFRTKNIEAVLDEEERIAIAILPFNNISTDTTNQYLLDGIMSSLLNYLSIIENVRVIASTSVEQYRGTTNTISEIGKKLNVNYILEGYGQKYEENFRLAINLSDTKNNALIWSNHYDRKVKEILDVQIEIAQKIVNQLRKEISIYDREISFTKPTFSDKAYTKYLQAEMVNRSNPHKAIELLEEAIEIDPQFVDAYVKLSGVQLSRANASIGELGSDSAFKLAIPPLEKALEIDPEHAGAHARLGNIKYTLEWDFKEAEKEFMKAFVFSGNPKYLSSSLYIQNRRYEKALNIALQKKDFDPLYAHYGLMVSYLYSGEYEKALEACNEYMELIPGFSRGWLGRIYMAMQDYDKAIQHFNYVIEDKRIPFFMSDLAICYHISGDKEKTKEILEELIERYNQGEQGCIAFMVGKIYSGIGEPDLALEWLETSYQDHEIELIWLYADPAFESLNDNEKYIGLLKRVGFEV